jgi:hypothetical protein
MRQLVENWTRQALNRPSGHGLNAAGGRTLRGARQKY